MEFLIVLVFWMSVGALWLGAVAGLVWLVFGRHGNVRPQRYIPGLGWRQV